jgi:hypothetical protein
VMRLTIVIIKEYHYYQGARSNISWLPHYATSQKVAGLSPNEVDLFNLPNHSSHTMALGLTRPLKQISTTNLAGGGGGGGVIGGEVLTL